MSTPIATAPTALRARSLAPDLARGAMLLLIALANSHTLLHSGDETIRGYPLTDSVADSVVAGVLTATVDGRAYPMFAALFGYGMVQILRRQERSGLDWVSARKLLRRRGWWMVLIGFLHALLLFAGDIIAAYGLVAVVFVGALRWNDKRLLRWAGLWLVVTTVIYSFFSLRMDADASMGSLAGEENPLIAAAFRGSGLLLSAPVLAMTTVGAAMIGVWAARRRILEEPAQHLGFLRRTAVIGITTGVVGGVPLALLTSGAMADTAIGVNLGFGAVHTVTGYAGALGYAAAVALIAVRVDERRGPAVTAVSAVGQRSMTCYLMQSVVWAVVFPPYLLGLGETWGPAPTAALAVATWLATVFAAELMRRADHRGPFEILLRRLTYRNARPSSVPDEKVTNR